MKLRSGNVLLSVCLNVRVLRSGREMMTTPLTVTRLTPATNVVNRVRFSTDKWFNVWEGKGSKRRKPRGLSFEETRKLSTWMHRSFSTVLEFCKYMDG